jgi:hypothetical protein
LWNENIVCVGCHAVLAGTSANKGPAAMAISSRQQSKTPLIIACILLAVASGAVACYWAGFFSPSLTGHIWLDRQNGDAIIGRGVRLYLLGPRMPRSAIADALNSRILELQGDFLSKDELFNTQQRLANLTGDMATDKAMDLIDRPIQESNALYNFGNAAASSNMATTKTDVNGQYDFANIPSGAVYLYCDYWSKVGRAQWLIKLNRGEKNVDLNNVNAKQ